jgi:hypothetical protein
MYSVFRIQFRNTLKLGGVAAAKPQTGWFPNRNISKCILDHPASTYAGTPSPLRQKLPNRLHHCLKAKRFLKDSVGAKLLCVVKVLT